MKEKFRRDNVLEPRRPPPVFQAITFFTNHGIIFAVYVTDSFSPEECEKRSLLLSRRIREKSSMYLNSLTEHQFHIFGGILVLSVVVFGLFGVLIYLDKRGIKTYLPRPKKLNRRERRQEKKPAKSKPRRR